MQTSITPDVTKIKNQLSGRQRLGTMLVEGVCTIKDEMSCVGWHVPIILLLRRPRQENYEFKASSQPNTALNMVPHASSLPYLLPFANTLFSLKPRVTGCVQESLGWLRVIFYSQTVHVQNTKTLTWQRYTLLYSHLS